MGLFRGKKSTTATTSTEQDAGFRQALDQIEPLDIAAEFPGTTEEQADIMEQMWIEVVSKVGGAGSFEPRQIAALSTLGERLVADNSSLRGFVERLRSIAETESARRPTDPSWRALVRHL
jgi:hypothetical protein